MRRPPIPPGSLVLLTSFALGLLACDGAAPPESTLAVLTAFPAETAAVLEHATITETRTVEGHIFRLGEIGQRRVVIGMTGIGLLNAEATTRVLLEHFEVAGVVFSGVAAGPLEVGDVIVASSFRLGDAESYATHTPWLDLAAELAQRGEIELERCAIVPDTSPPDGVTPGVAVCLPHEPRLVVGGAGTSSDPFGDTPLECVPDLNDVFACDAEGYSPVSIGPWAPAGLVRLEPGEEATLDQETAAVAREVEARELPFVAFRGASDGGKDPLGLSGFDQFFVYYRLAAHNAAEATAAFVVRAD